jgi:hypothetical protein
MAVLLTSCAAIGTKTLYNSPSKPKILKIGVADLYDNEQLSYIFPETNETFKRSIQQVTKEKGSYSVVLFNKEMDFDNPNKELIVNKCALYGIDAVLISRLKFIHVKYTMMFVPIGQNYDTEVEMKLIDKNGNLILSTRHNTYKGNSYATFPTAETTIMDGTKGALKRIYSELDK